MKVFAHRKHRFFDARRGQLYVIPACTWKELPDEVAGEIISGHPDKVCDVTEETEPNNHTCPKTEQAKYETTVIQAPPVNTMMVPVVRKSAQKRNLEKRAKHRSRRARLGV